MVSSDRPLPEGAGIRYQTEKNKLLLSFVRMSELENYPFRVIHGFPPLRP